MSDAGFRCVVSGKRDPPLILVSHPVVGISLCWCHGTDGGRELRVWWWVGRPLGAQIDIPSAPSTHSQVSIIDRQAIEQTLFRSFYHL